MVNQNNATLLYMVIASLSVNHIYCVFPGDIIKKKYTMCFLSNEMAYFSAIGASLCDNCARTLFLGEKYTKQPLKLF